VVVLNWNFCITSSEERVLKLCYGSMDEGGGYGYGNNYATADGSGPSDLPWEGYSENYNATLPDGYSSGYGYNWGDGYSHREWQ
jgi:hypothetical protein